MVYQSSRLAWVIRPWKKKIKRKTIKNNSSSISIPDSLSPQRFYLVFRQGLSLWLPSNPQQSYLPNAEMHRLDLIPDSFFRNFISPPSRLCMCLSICVYKIRSHIAHNGLDCYSPEDDHLLILLPLGSEFWHHRHGPQHSMYTVLGN